MTGARRRRRRPDPAPASRDSTLPWPDLGWDGDDDTRAAQRRRQLRSEGRAAGQTVARLPDGGWRRGLPGRRRLRLKVARLRCVGCS
ncbi:Os04g0503000 [Oryza sativa Japonica Group]|uniref:Os04g0503000 protein n=1 Tax=Oryza sativa subsp. japonica TaxID=39947 RepID=A0A0P0WC63_ORYSJ|nr:Os04g0503000 [Oryza sativa Japonica Group]